MSTDDAQSSFLTIPFFGVIASVTLILARKYFKGAQFEEHVSAKGKIAFVTGANNGIGKQTVRELNQRGAKVYMLCRSIDRGREAMLDLVKLGCEPTRLIVKQIDLADFSSVRKFADDIGKEVEKLDILVNNAGIMSYPRFEKTNDGFETTWQTNYLGHFLLTELLLPILRNAPSARIINVSSSLHKRADSVDAAVVNSKAHFNRTQPYNRSKLANVMHARELTRRLRVSDPACTITINSLHPGICFTGLGRHIPLYRTPFKQMIAPFMWFFMKTDKDGAQTSLYLALSKQVQGISGRYFGECKEDHPSEKALDNDACNVLYNYSVEAVGLNK
uniref:Retinol dehydrogenase 14 n=1 Tax=Ascaris suum TaxID=6253 RepID=F1L7F0_ASCSU